MTRDPLLPTRLVDGVWISGEPAVASPIVDDPFTPTPPSTGVRNFHCDPYPPPWVKVASLDANQSTDATDGQPGIMALGRGGEWPCSVTLPPRPATDYARAFAEYNPPPVPRRIFAAVALDGSGVWAIGDSAEEVRSRAVARRGHLYNVAERVGAYYPPPTPDAAWLDTLALVTLSGTTESLRATVASVDDVIPWCPADLWDSGETAP